MSSGLLDLSSLSDALVGLLKTAIQTSPLWTTNGGDIPPFHVDVSGSSPDAVRAEGGHCQLTLYLMHIARDPTFRNAPVSGPRGQLNVQQPVSLVLSYLLTAYAGADANREQQTMGIALRCLHDNAIYRPSAADKATYKLPDDEYTVTLAGDSLDEMSRLWQSITVAYRLSCVFRVSVALLAPLVETPPPAPPPDQVGLSVGPATEDLADEPQLSALMLEADMTKPASGDDPAGVTVKVAPEIAVAGQTITFGGLGLDLPIAVDVYLVSLDGTTTRKVSAWRGPAVARPDMLTITLPSAYAAALSGAPAKAPPAGLYLLSVGSDGPPAVRSPAVPLPLAARIDGVLDPPKLTPDGSGLYVVNGAGFSAADTQVLLQTVPLSPGASPGFGVFAVNPAGTRISFRLPTVLDAGRYWLRVRTAGVESPPSWWIDAP